MKLMDEYRDQGAAQDLVERIRRTAHRRWSIMEVCGGQTHGLLRYGIDDVLDSAVQLIHGPGCPVCVTGVELVDTAVELGHTSGILLTTFGDMMRVPGSKGSLSDARARGAHVKAVYSPLDAVRLAQSEPEAQVVFFAVGFETTAPATALALRQAAHLNLSNFSLLVAHVRVQPAMELLMTRPHQQIDGFLAAGHVCTVLGYDSYHEFCAKYHVPVVVTGFEPLDLLTGILACVRQLEEGRAVAENGYARSVRLEGNRTAQELIASVYQPTDIPWRGLGWIAGGGLRLKEAWRHYDAMQRFGLKSLPILEQGECRSAEVLSGLIRPSACSAFGGRCTPETPLGAPMVSSEGACAAYFHYHRASATSENRTIAPETAGS